MHITAFSVALALAAVAPTAHAQAVAVGDTLVFERVGDEPLDANDLAFDETGALWAVQTDVWRLDAHTNSWEEVGIVSAASHILPLGPDTLLVGGGGTVGSVRRSVDGGEEWTRVADFGLDLFEAPASGTLLAGTATATGVGYSPDRGATWALAAFTGNDPGDAEAFAALPPGHPHAGRLLAGGLNGVMYSDDDGRTWAPSSLWQDFFYLVMSVAVGPNGRAWATEIANLEPGTRLRVSGDGGETWAVAHTFTETGGTGSHVVAVPGGPDPEAGVLVVVEYDGDVWVSEDGAQSWRRAGHVPFEGEGHLEDAALSADGRLYVAGGQSGPEDEWVFRTTTPVVTASAPGAPPEEPGVGLEVRPNPFQDEATVALTLRAPSRVQVAVYDVLGREVAALADGAYAAGRYSFELESAALSAGVYVVRAEAGGTVVSRVVTLIGR
jgi:hypothetical protein